MTYYTGSIAAVPTANKQQYIEHATAAWPLFQSYGATRMVETWGVDVPKGKITDFHGAVNAKDTESIVFSWIAWPDRATADAAWQRMENDPAMKALPEMPFGGGRMIFGGFSPVFEQGNHTGADYYQGFVLAVPAKNRAAYVEMASQGWQMIEKGGALGMIETWGDEVPHGSKPISTARPGPKRTRFRSSAGWPGPTVRPATPPPRRWRRRWGTWTCRTCRSTACA